MILFYKKKTGEIFSIIDGRVHDESNIGCSVDDGSGEEIEKYIIGWTEKDGIKTEHNMDRFELLQKFEDLTPFSFRDCKIDIKTGNIIEK